MTHLYIYAKVCVVGPFPVAGLVANKFEGSDGDSPVHGGHACQRGGEKVIRHQRLCYHPIIKAVYPNQFWRLHLLHGIAGIEDVILPGGASAQWFK